MVLSKNLVFEACEIVEDTLLLEEETPSKSDKFGINASASPPLEIHDLP